MAYNLACVLFRKTTTLMVGTVVVIGLATSLHGDTIAWYLYGDNMTDALPPPGPVSGFYTGTTDVGATKTYADAFGSGRTVTAAAFEFEDYDEPDYDPEVLVEHTRDAENLGIGIEGGTDADELDEDEVIRLQLDLTLTDYNVYFSSVSDGEGVEVATSSLSTPDNPFGAGVYIAEFSGSSWSSDAGTGGVPVNLTTTFAGHGGLQEYVFFREASQGRNDDVLIMQLSASPVPLPAAGLMGLVLLVGIGGIGTVRRRIRTQQ